MCRGLAAFHRVLEREHTIAVSPGIKARSEEIERLIAGEFDQLQAVIERHPWDRCTVAARVWLARARGRSLGVHEETSRLATQSFVLQPCIRDARPDHFLFEGNRLSGLVDFGAMGRETVAADLARLLAESIGGDRVARARALEAYEAVRPLDGAEARAITTFVHANALLGPARWIRWHFLESRQFDQPDAPLQGILRGLERLDEAGL
jgi:Ser/Thr protein kinase RdoA (MazF antagonist)